jgi:gluconate:H+ symporter, GntP family
MGLVALLVVAVLFIILSTTRLKLHPFLALIAAALGFGLAARMPAADVIAAIKTGFGGTIGGIGIVIIAGTVIGKFLEKSGGALRLAERIVRLTGERRVPLATALIGYVVSIPVFCDSGFVILVPLAKALARRAGTSLAAAAIALSLGLYATHTMVPPTPGPILAAAQLGADLGLVIVFGLPVSLIALGVGWLFAVRVAGRVHLDLDEAPETTVKVTESEEGPSAFHATVPILLPIVLIVLRSIAGLPAAPFGDGRVAVILAFLGEPIVALLIGVAVAFTLPRRFERSMWSTSGWVGEALLNAAVIILITGAGGAFGKVLQQSGIADVMGEALGGAGIGIWLPFILAAAIKTAQGSSTVAIITTASLIAPLLGALGLDAPAAKALTVVAIGAGSMVASHANDSYFWVVTQLTGMDVKTGYQLQTLGSALQGVTAAVVVWVIAMMVI